MLQSVNIHPLLTEKGACELRMRSERLKRYVTAIIDEFLNINQKMKAGEHV